MSAETNGDAVCQGRSREAFRAGNAIVAATGVARRQQPYGCFGTVFSGCPCYPLMWCNRDREDAALDEIGAYLRFEEIVQIHVVGRTIADRSPERRAISSTIALATKLGSSHGSARLALASFRMIDESPAIFAALNACTAWAHISSRVPVGSWMMALEAP